MSTTEYLDKLTIDQLRYARDEADRRIKKAESVPKKIVWVVTNGSYNVSWHREEDWQNAVNSLIKTLQTDKTISWRFEDMIDRLNATRLVMITADLFVKCRWRLLNIF